MLAVMSEECHGRNVKKKNGISKRQQDPGKMGMVHRVIHLPFAVIAAYVSWAQIGLIVYVESIRIRTLISHTLERRERRRTYSRAHCLDKCSMYSNHSKSHTWSPDRG